MAIYLKPGDTLPLILDLHDNDDSKYVRCRIFDEDWVEQPTSPVNLVNQGDGIYNYSSLVFPSNEDILYARYKVYNDSGYTQESIDHTTAVDTFLKQEDLNQGVVDDLRRLIESQPDLLSLVGVIDEQAGSSGRTVIVHRGEIRDIACKVRYQEFGNFRGDPYPLTDVSEITAFFKKKDRKLLEKKLSQGDITIASEDYGKIIIHLDENDTESLKLGKRIDFYIEVISTSGIRQIKFFRALEVRNLTP